MYLVKLNGNSFLVDEINMICNFMTSAEIKNIRLPLHNRIPVPFYDTFKVKMLMFCGEQDLFYKEARAVIDGFEITVGYKVSLVIESQSQCSLHINFTKIEYQSHTSCECLNPNVGNLSICCSSVDFYIAKSNSLIYCMDIPYEFVHTIIAYQDDTHIYKILRHIDVITEHGFVSFYNSVW